MKKITGLVVISMATLLIGCDKKCPPKLVTHNFTKQQWMGSFNSIFKDIKLHLNNYTSTKHQFEQDDDSAYKSPKSSSLLVPAVSTVPSYFDIAVARADPYSLYINDVNSTSFVPDAGNGLASITISFESDGTEIIGDCVNNLFCGLCGGAPMVELDNILMVVPLAFSPQDGSVAIEAQDVSFTSGYQESGPCSNNFCAFACDIFAPNRKSDMRKAIQQNIEDYFNINSFLIASQFDKELQQLGVTGSIVAIQIKTDGDLMVEDSENQTCN